MEGYPSAGSVIAGRYRIESLLGEGGMGAVFRATDVRPGNEGRQVALKFVAAEMRNRPGIASRFANEAVAASKIASEHSVQILGVEATEDGTPFIVMELLEGQDLDAIIEKDSPLDAERAIHFALQILRALQVAHGAGVIHRDLKPGNCYVVTKDGEPDWVKIIDFGIGKILGDETSQLTKTSTTLGTPAYMSPEQAKSAKGADARSDLYSVGVILYELLTKKRPFEGDSHNEIVVKICTEPPVPLRSHRTDLPSKLVAAVEHALVKAPSGRYGSAIEFALALKPMAGKRSAGVLSRIEGTSASLPVKPAQQQAPALGGSTDVKIAGAGGKSAPIPSALKGSTAGMDDLAHSSTEPSVVQPTNQQAFIMASAQTAPVPQQQPSAQAQPPGGRPVEKTVMAEPGPMTFGPDVGSGRNVTEQALPVSAAAYQQPAAAYAVAPQAYSPPAYSQGPYSEDEPESRRGGAGGLMWILGVLAIGLIGSGIYFAVASSSSKAAPGSTIEATDEDLGDDDEGAGTVAKKKKPKPGTDEGDDDDDDVPPPSTVTNATTKPTVKPKPTTTTTTPPKPTTTTPPPPTTTTTVPSTTTTTTTTVPSTTTTTTTPPPFPFPFPFPSTKPKPPPTTTTPPPPTTTTPPPPTVTTPPTIITIPTTPPPPTTTVPPPPTATTPPVTPTSIIIKPKIGGT